MLNYKQVTIMLLAYTCKSSQGKAAWVIEAEPEVVTLSGVAEQAGNYVVIGLTASSSQQTLGFFNQNLVMEYSRTPLPMG
jgi:hypothetical protein